MRVQGWYPDPYGSHDDRWFSGGEPTSLVRDQGIESFDEPPRGQLPLNPLDRGEVPQERLPPYPSGPAGEQERSARARRAWHWWTVCLPGVLALAVSFSIAVIAALGQVMNDCFDTCGSPGPPAGQSAMIGQEWILFAAVIALLVGGLAVPAWRRVITPALWAAIALAVAFVPLRGS